MNKFAWSLAVSLLAAPAFAQDRLGDLERKVEALSSEIEKLKLGEAAADPVAEGQKPGQAPAASKVYRAAERKISLGGYGEMLFQNFSKDAQNGNTAGTRDEADMLRLVIYAGYKFNDWILFNSELEFEHATSKVSGGGARGEVSVEQAFIDFKLSDPLGIRAGMVLVPVGIANEIHEPTTFHGSRRPSVEQSVIPSTWRENGAGIFGAWGPLSYRSYLMTGLQAVSASNVAGFNSSTGLRNGRSSGAKSFAEDLAWASRIDYSPVEGVVAGGSFYVGQADQNLTAAAVPVTLWDLHATAEYKGLELRGLYTEVYLGNADAVNAAQVTAGTAITAANGATIGRKMFGGYGEAAFNLLSLRPTKHYLAPFVRYERYDTQADTPASFAKNPANSRVEYTLGVSYKPIPQVAVKTDYQWIRNQARTGVNQWNASLAFIF